MGHNRVWQPRNQFLRGWFETEAGTNPTTATTTAVRDCCFHRSFLTITILAPARPMQPCLQRIHSKELGHKEEDPWEIIKCGFIIIIISISLSSAAFPLEQQICSLSSQVLSLISPPPAFLPSFFSSFLIDKTQKKGNKKNKNTKNTQKLLGGDLSLLLSPPHQNQNPNQALTEGPQESYNVIASGPWSPNTNNNNKKKKKKKKKKNLFQLKTIHELNNKKLKYLYLGLMSSGRIEAATTRSQ